MKTRFPSELLCAFGLVVAVASVFGLAFFDRSEWLNAALGLIGIPVAGGLLVAILDMIFERKTPSVQEEQRYFARAAITQRTRQARDRISTGPRRRVVSMAHAKTDELARCA